MMNCWSGLVIEQFFSLESYLRDGMDICITDSTKYKSTASGAKNLQFQQKRARNCKICEIRIEDFRLVF